MKEIIAIQLLREKLSQQAAPVRQFEAQGLPERAGVNQNASVAPVVYRLWSGTIGADALTPRDILRMEALGIWEGDRLSNDAVALIEAIDRQADEADQAAAAERAELAASVQLDKLQRDAELLNAAWDMLKYRPERQASGALEPPPLLPEPDALMADYGPVGNEADITSDMLLEAFEVDPTETASVVKTLSATRLKHLSEVLNVERAALDREHQATGIANPRSASIDRLLGLLTRRGEV